MHLRSKMASEPSAETVLIPAAMDGTTFDPLYYRKRGYQIGPKGSEHWHADYWEALRLLRQMKPPKWRRPNAAGNWGLVTGVRWVERERSSLEQVLAALGMGGRP